MNQVSQNLISIPSHGRFCSPAIKVTVRYSAVITLVTAFYTMNIADAYLRNLRSEWHMERFQSASVFLVLFVIITAVLAHICRPEENIISRILLFLPWGLGVAVLISYWGVLILPL